MNNLNGIKLVLAKFKSMPLGAFVKKVWRKFICYIAFRFEASLDINRDTRQRSELRVNHSYIDVAALETDHLNLKVLKHLCDQHVNHIYDLLGSGPVNVTYNNVYHGVANQLYRPKRIDFTQYDELVKNLLLKPHAISAIGISGLIDCNYEPIDWQVDFKSGFRWLERIPSFMLQYGDVLGADIKIPWELSRLQHLPQLAIISLKDKENKEIYLNEIRNQTLDFIVMNPPRMGANWVCAMDVGIRIANLLVAHDIAQQIDINFADHQYLSILSQSVYEHGLHIINHLEYSQELTSNHYLANIVGLLFASSFLESCEEVDQWLAFSIQELVSEVKRQFYEDGCNFEGSTSYHRLSTEMLVYALALINGLPTKKYYRLDKYVINGWNRTPKLLPYVQQEYTVTSSGVELPEWLIKRIGFAINFSINITKPNGDICQIGDNDSGRFFRFTPIGHFLAKDEALKQYKNMQVGKSSKYKDGLYWDESCLNHGSYISAASGLFKLELPNFITFCQLEKSIIFSLGKRELYPVTKTSPSETSKSGLAAELEADKYIKCVRITISSGKNCAHGLLKELKRNIYPDGGIVVFRSSRLYICLYNVPNGSRGNGGHSHNDQLSVEISIDGIDVCKDPGSYLYTPDPIKRNEFRSVNAHNTLKGSTEPNGFFGSGNELFAKENNTRGFFSMIGKLGATMDLSYGKIYQRRTVSLFDDKIVIEDQSNKEFDSTLNQFYYYSNGYGKLALNAGIGPIIKIEYTKQ
ncbi:heparinase II/III family protein [Thermodesulfobacteriota bacterium]